MIQQRYHDSPKDQVMGEIENLRKSINSLQKDMEDKEEIQKQ